VQVPDLFYRADRDTEAFLTHLEGRDDIAGTKVSFQRCRPSSPSDDPASGVPSGGTTKFI
jgi:hypothetical protein